MSMGQRGISFVIGAVDKFTQPLDQFSAKMAQSTAGLRRLGASMKGLGVSSGLSGVSQGFGGVATAGMAFASKMALIGGGLGYGFKKGFVDVASQFEKFETILTTLNMGDTAKSKKELGWISDFAAKTPYELAEVTEAFVQLRSFGLEPMNGLLTTLGDTSAAMGKPIKQAVEAIADAVTGENERLKEFGIVGKKVGDKIVYSYTNASGAQAKMMAKANDRAAIQAVLTKIWAEKYGGGMAKLSTTFGGMMSNLSDAWARFATKVMNNGAFDWMKGKLQGILSTIDAMAADGRLDAWAKQWGESITSFFERAWEAGKGFASALSVVGEKLTWTAELLGGWENMGKLVVGLMATSLIVAVGNLAVAFGLLGTAIMTTPIGWLLLIGVSLYVMFNKLTKAWDGFMESLRANTPDWIKKLVGMGDPRSMSGRDGSSAGAKKDMFNAFPELKMNLGGKAKGDGTGWTALAAPQRTFDPSDARHRLGAAEIQRRITENRSTFTQTQQSKITVDFANTPKGTSIRNSGAPIDLGVDYSLGIAMPEAG